MFTLAYDYTINANVLALRDNSPTVSGLFFLGLKRAGVLLAYFAVGAALLAATGWHISPAIFVGFILGHLAQDYHVAKATVGIWPMYVEVLRWDELARLHEGAEKVKAESSEPAV